MVPFLFGLVRWGCGKFTLLPTHGAYLTSGPSPYMLEETLADAYYRLF